MQANSTCFLCRSLKTGPCRRRGAGLMVRSMDPRCTWKKLASFFRAWFRSVAGPLCVCLGLAISNLPAAERHGKVTFGGLPVPGATVTAAQGDKKLVAITDLDGNYSFPDLPDGAWTLQVEMLGFEPLRHEVNIAADAAIPDAD